MCTVLHNTVWDMLVYITSTIIITVVNYYYLLTTVMELHYICVLTHVILFSDCCITYLYCVCAIIEHNKTG